MRERIYSQYVDAWEESGAPDGVAGFNVRAASLKGLIQHHFPADRNASVLDLGCGHGALLYFAGQAGYKNLRGIDASLQQLEVAAKLGIDCIEEGDLMEVLANTPEASQDVVIAFDVIEHFTKDELIDFVDAVLRVLKPGGSWIIHVPNAESPFGASVRYSCMTHELAFTRSSMEQLMRASGFSSVNCFEDGPTVHGFKSFLRVMVWECVRMGLRLWTAAETGDTGGQAVFTRNLLAVVVK